jgi:hypothetical protein
VQGEAQGKTRRIKSDMTRYKFPFVYCDEHKGPQRSIAICNHLRHEPDHYNLASYTEPTDEEMGEALCDLHLFAGISINADDLSVICESHFKEIYREQLGEYNKTK